MKPSRDIREVQKELLGYALEQKPVLLHGKYRYYIEKMVEEVGKFILMQHQSVCYVKMYGEDAYTIIAADLINGKDSFFFSILYCNPKDETDTKYYKKLAKIINQWFQEFSEQERKELREKNEANDKVFVDIDCPEKDFRYDSTQWIVVYSEEPENFPQYFLDQFELVSLECMQEKPTAKFTDGVETEKGQNEKQEKKSTSEKVLLEIDRNNNLLKYKNKNEKLDPIQIQLLILLYENKGNPVTRNVIFNCIWGDAVVGEAQITDHISKIKKAFMALGVGKEIIQTVRKSKVTKGGYIFNGNMASLDSD
jgi:DNA-binding winged helix-turn-helix (wHTH) protein